MSSKVAAVEFDKGNIQESLNKALQLIGTDTPTTSHHPVVIKVGVYSHKTENHSTIDVVKSIINAFSNAPAIYIAESDNTQGTGLERLQLWKELFTGRVVPFNLSDDTNTKRVTLAGQEMDLSHILFKPHILVDTHILRSYERGSILKNLFGCVPYRKKVIYHKVLPTLLADIYETIGGVDLAVLDGTYFFRKTGGIKVRTNTLLVGSDAVAVETVGAILAGMGPEKMLELQEFVQRGLGEGDINNIEVVGIPFDTLQEKFAKASETLEELYAQAPKPWSPAEAVNSLIERGFFDPPHKRTKEEVKKALEADDPRAKGRSKMIMATLRRRAKKGVIKSEKGPEGWIFWKE
ncbi:MAG: DUF362 domain-containing protein [Theionarchaea archaeon]|nr:MAG: hypothetical protein AYK18_15715 [Theionarchaea archaeon DG-70]MBU7009934.1 DUF362 domain-containing protein [Theionarchaea archaeon]